MSVAQINFEKTASALLNDMSHFSESSKDLKPGLRVLKVLQSMDERHADRPSLMNFVRGLGFEKVFGDHQFDVWLEALFRNHSTLSDALVALHLNDFDDDLPCCDVEPNVVWALLFRALDGTRDELRVAAEAAVRKVDAAQQAFDSNGHVTNEQYEDVFAALLPLLRVAADTEEGRAIADVCANDEDYVKSKKRCRLCQDQEAADDRAVPLEEQQKKE